MHYIRTSYTELEHLSLDAYFLLRMLWDYSGQIVGFPLVGEKNLKNNHMYADLIDSHKMANLWLETTPHSALN